MNQKSNNGRFIMNGNSEENNNENHCCWEISSITSPTLPATPANTPISKLNSLDCWDYTIELECLQGPQDLELAAELGKTLLERNKELETSLKQHQNVIDDQTQEIEFLQKQNNALREVNDSRLSIYEHLEVGIQDLERANHRLIVENTADKKHIKSLLHNIENLEQRIEEHNKSYEDIKKALDVERRKNERFQQEKNNQKEQNNIKLKQTNFDSSMNESNNDDGYEHNSTPENGLAFESLKETKIANSTGTSDILMEALDASNIANEENEELIKLMTEMEKIKKSCISEQQKVAELEEQLVTIIQENQSLQSRIVQTSCNEEMKSIHDELSILEEVRQGTMCSRCLRSVDDRNAIEDGSSIMDTEDGDDRSLLELMNPTESAQLYRSAVTIKIAPKPNSLELNNSNPNPYRELVEKYEALLEVQRHSINRNHRQQQQQPSLQDEFQTSGEFNSINTKDIEEGFTGSDKNTNSTTAGSETNGSIIEGNNTSNSIHNRTLQPRKNCMRTPTDFSEAETSSSGFSDETSNKGTQTDERQGFFLCSIGDGEDCKFSIYDDASPIDSRFRNRPEYRELFKEIFAVLKKAAENKEEGENLPLLDDTHPIVSKVPPVTPANEDLPDFGDDTQSIISSAVSEQSVAMSECITKTERKTAVKKYVVEKGQENKPPIQNAGQITSDDTPSQGTCNGKTAIVENGRVLKAFKREPLEYLSVSVGIKKKNRKKNRNFNNDRSDSPILPSPPRVFFTSGKKRRDLRPFNTTSTVSPSTSNNLPPASTTKNEWNGNSMVIYNRSLQSQTPSPKGRELDINEMEFKPSTASQDLHKLKKLELSYAEVLRRADACKHHHRRK